MAQHGSGSALVVVMMMMMMMMIYTLPTCFGCYYAVCIIKHVSGGMYIAHYEPSRVMSLLDSVFRVAVYLTLSRSGQSVGL